MSDSGIGNWFKRHILPVVLAPLGLLVVSLATLYVTDVTKRSPEYYKSAFASRCEGYDFLGPRKPYVVVLLPGDSNVQSRYGDFVEGLRERLDEHLAGGPQSKVEEWPPQTSSIAEHVRTSVERLRNRGDVGVVVCVGTEVVEAIASHSIPQPRIAALVTSRKVLAAHDQSRFSWSFEVGDAASLGGAVCVAKELASLVAGGTEAQPPEYAILRGLQQRSSAWVRRQILESVEKAEAEIRFLVGLEDQSIEDLMASTCRPANAYLVLHDREMLSASREIARAAFQRCAPLVVTATALRPERGRGVEQRPAAVYGVDYKEVGRIAADDVAATSLEVDVSVVRVRRADGEALRSFVLPTVEARATGVVPPIPCRQVVIDTEVLDHMRRGRKLEPVDRKALEARLVTALAAVGCAPAITFFP